MTEMLDKNLKGIITVVKQQDQKLRNVFNSKLQVTWQEIGVAQDTELTWQDLEATSTNACWVKTVKLGE
jgi:hypothetical protein